MKQYKNLFKTKWLIIAGLMYIIVILGTINPYNILYYKWLILIFRVIACTFILPLLGATWVIFMSKEF